MVIANGFKDQPILWCKTILNGVVMTPHENGHTMVYIKHQGGDILYHTAYFLPSLGEGFTCVPVCSININHLIITEIYIFLLSKTKLYHIKHIIKIMYIYIYIIKMINYVKKYIIH